MSGRKSFNRPDASRLAAHIVQHYLARALQAVALLGGVVGAFWHGWQSIALGAVVAYVFGMARPGPDDTLDDWTGRGR